MPSACFDSNQQCITALETIPKAETTENHKVVKILWRLVAVSNGSKIPLFDFFSAFDVSRPWKSVIGDGGGGK